MGAGHRAARGRWEQQGLVPDHRGQFHRGCERRGVDAGAFDGRGRAARRQPQRHRRRAAGREWREKFPRGFAPRTIHKRPDRRGAAAAASRADDRGHRSPAGRAALRPRGHASFFFFWIKDLLSVSRIVNISSVPYFVPRLSKYF